MRCNNLNILVAAMLFLETLCEFTQSSPEITAVQYSVKDFIIEIQWKTPDWWIDNGTYHVKSCTNKCEYSNRWITEKCHLHINEATTRCTLPFNPIRRQIKINGCLAKTGNCPGKTCETCTSFYHLDFIDVINESNFTAPNISVPDFGPNHATIYSRLPSPNFMENNNQVVHSAMIVEHGNFTCETHPFTAYVNKTTKIIGVSYEQLNDPEAGTMRWKVENLSPGTEYCVSATYRSGLDYEPGYSKSSSREARAAFHTTSLTLLDTKPATGNMVKMVVLVTVLGVLIIGLLTIGLFRALKAIKDFIYVPVPESLVKVMDKEPQQNWIYTEELRNSTDRESLTETINLQKLVQETETEKVVVEPDHSISRSSSVSYIRRRVGSEETDDLFSADFVTNRSVTDHHQETSLLSTRTEDERTSLTGSHHMATYDSEHSELTDDLPLPGQYISK